jgi:hypothetical protein
MLFCPLKHWEKADHHEGRQNQNRAHGKTSKQSFLSSASPQKKGIRSLAQLVMNSNLVSSQLQIFEFRFPNTNKYEQHTLHTSIVARQECMPSAYWAQTAPAPKKCQLRTSFFLLRIYGRVCNDLVNYGFASVITDSWQHCIHVVVICTRRYT